MKATVSFAAALLFAATCLGVCRADTAGISFTSPTNLMNNSLGFSLGFQFTANQTITVTALGYFDDGGLQETHQVGLYNSKGVLLSTTTVTGAGLQDGFFNYSAVTPITLQAGQSYEVMANSGYTDPYAYETTGFAVNPSITFVSDEFASGNALQFGTRSEGITAAAGGGFFGPNFEQSAVTPEPGSLLLLGTGLLGGVGAMRRRRMAA